MKRVRLAAVVLVVVLLASCASAPEPPAVEESLGKSDTQAERDSIVLAESLRKARVAIARAADAGASSESLKDARDALAEGERLQISDPNVSWAQLEKAAALARTAYQNSVGLSRQRLEIQLDDMLEQLREEQVDRFTPEQYLSVSEEVIRAKELFSSGKITDGTEMANSVIRRMQILLDSVGSQLDRVLSLKSDTEALIDQLGAEGDLGTLYEMGRNALDSYALGEAERRFGAAREVGREDLRATNGVVSQGAAQEKAEELMLIVMKQIENASLLTVITDEEIIVEPVEWSGSQFLEQSSSDLSIAIGQFTSDGESIDQVAQYDLLEEAKKLWILGLEQNRATNYRQSKVYLEQAKIFSEAYISFAIMTTYTVRLIPERRDSLWRIAEYDFIYGNPWLWPRIWHRNRKLIQNPDLIYPGWQLYIPPAP